MSLGLRAIARSARLLVMALGCAVFGVATGCVAEANPGVDPPSDQLFFPGGLLLDPRRGDGEPSRYLFVTNGNNDLSFNAATISVVDLDAFFEAWFDEEFGVYPYCESAPTDGRSRRRCVLDRGSETSDAFPCRRLGLLPQVVECDESTFVVDSVRVEDFVTALDASVMEPNGVPRLWAPARGGPSITYIDVETRPDGSPDLACGQGRVDGDADDEERCSDRYRLTNLRNDDDLLTLDREPFNILVDEFVPDGATEPAYRYAYVAHSASPTLTLIDLDGLRGDDGVPTRPAIVDQAPVFTPSSTNPAPFGGFGLARRPCSNTVDPRTNRPLAPSITLGCQRPLVYGTLRFQLTMANFTIGGIDAPPLPSPDFSCFDDADYEGPYCATPQDLGKPCTILCEPRILGYQPFAALGLDPLSPTTAATFGDIAFADETGDRLYAVQTNPGALLEFDTSTDLTGATLDIPRGAPIELCDQPTKLALDVDSGMAFVSCFRAALLYVVDLRARRVIETVVTGTGPHDVVVDPVRHKVYVANTLESSVSVIELDITRRDYLREIARIGLQEPFSR